MVLRNRKKTLKDEISRLFKNSMLTGIPQIIEAGNWKKRITRSLVFVICVSGFIYQTLSFINVYLKYETVVDIQVYSPTEIDKPAYTVCGEMGLMSSKFCPTVDEEFTRRTGVECEEIENRKDYDYCFCHPRMCQMGQGSLNLTLIKPGGIKWVRQQPWDWLQEFVATENDYIRGCVEVNQHMDESLNSCDKPSNNSISVPCYSNGFYPESCFTRNSLYGKPDDKPQQVMSFGELWFSLYVLEREYPVDRRDPKLYISFHSPYTIKNPMKHGYVMEVSDKYIFRLSKVVKNLLPYPYATDCIDYMSMWKARGGKGPTNLHECTQECLRNRSLEVHGCLLKGIDYPGYDTLCGETEADENLIAASKECMEITCKPACYEEIYITKADQSLEPGQENGCTKRSLLKYRKAFLRVAVTFAGMETTVYTYVPKYQDMEIFSYIGGYIGMWLGISLIAVFDFMETVVMLMRYPLNRMLRWRQRNKVNRFNSDRKRIY